MQSPRVKRKAHWGPPPGRFQDSRKGANDYYYEDDDDEDDYDCDGERQGQGSVVAVGVKSGTRRLRDLPPCTWPRPSTWCACGTSTTRWATLRAAARDALAMAIRTSGGSACRLPDLVQLHLEDLGVAEERPSPVPAAGGGGAVEFRILRFMQCGHLEELLPYIPPPSRGWSLPCMSSCWSTSSKSLRRS